MSPHMEESSGGQQASDCQFCGAQIYWKRSRRTGKSYPVNDPDDHKSFHNCREREQGFSKPGAGSSSKPALTSPKAKAKWLEQTLTRCADAIDKGDFNLMDVSESVRKRFLDLLTTAGSVDATAQEAAKEAETHGDIPF